MQDKNFIYEYQSIPDTNFKKYIQENTSLHTYFSQDINGTLKPKNYCGIIHVEGEDFYILPKISDKDSENQNIFIYMLMIAHDMKLSNEALSESANQKHRIMEVFIQLFTQSLLKELRRGLFKQYITYQENLQVLRGKYLINENLKHNFTKQKIYCEFDEFSADNTLNQFFLYAIKVFSRHTQDRKALKMCEMILEEVGYTHIDIDKLEIHFDRLNSRYKKSYDIAIMILKQYIPLISQDKQSFAFLFDMNVLFENFVGKMIPDARLQIQKDFGSLRLKPDIMIDNLIIDTKYKKVSSKGDLSPADKYQMFVYGKNFSVKNTMLLYPQHKKDICEDLVLGEGAESVDLMMRSLDMRYDGEFEGFEEVMRKRIEEIVR